MFHTLGLDSRDGKLTDSPDGAVPMDSVASTQPGRAVAYFIHTRGSWSLGVM